jgi:hypothetical protein
VIQTAGEEAAARAENGGVYPVGTVIQLIPFEAMVKRHEGWNPATGDWELFMLDSVPEVSPQGKARRRLSRRASPAPAGAPMLDAMLARLDEDDASAGASDSAAGERPAVDPRGIVPAPLFRLIGDIDAAPWRRLLRGIYRLLVADGQPIPHTLLGWIARVFLRA